MSESKPTAIRNLQARVSWIDNYELACQDRDHLVGICNSKEVQLKAIGYQLEKGIKAVEEFLANESLPYTEGFWKLAKPLEEFVASAKEELRLWEDKR